MQFPYPFNGVAFRAGSQTDLLFDGYVMRVGTLNVEVLGSTYELYNWSIWRRQETAFQISDGFVCETFPVTRDLQPPPNVVILAGDELIQPYWVPVNDNRLVSLTEQPEPLVIGYGDLIATVPLTRVAFLPGSVRVLIAPSSEVIGFSEFGLARPSDLSNGTFISVAPVRVPDLNSTFSNGYPNRIAQLFVSEVQRPAMTESEAYQMLSEAGSKIDKLRFNYVSGYWARGSMVGDGYIPSSSWDPTQPSTALGHSTFLGGSFWADYGLIQCSSEWVNTFYSETMFPYVFGRLFSQCFWIEDLNAVLYSPITFISPYDEIFLTDEFIDEINNEFGFEVLKRDRIKVIGFWPVGSIAFEHPLLDDGSVYLPNWCVIEGWLVHDRAKSIARGSPYFRLEVEKAIEIPTYRVFYVQSTQRLWSLISTNNWWTFHNYTDANGSWHWYASGSIFMPRVSIPVELRFLGWNGDYQSLIESIASAIEKIVSKRIIVYSHGLSTPFVFSNLGTELDKGITLWEAQGYMGVNCGPISPVLDAMTLKFWNLHAFQMFTRNGMREAIGSLLTFAGGVGSCLRRVYSQPDWESFTRNSWYFTKGSRTIVRHDEWVTAMPSVYQEFTWLAPASVNYPYGSQFYQNFDTWAIAPRLAAYVGLPINDVFFVSHKVVLNQPELKITPAPKQMISAKACIKTIKHDNTKSVILVVEAKTNFAAWLLNAISYGYGLDNPPSLQLLERSQPFLGNSVQLCSIDTGLDESLPPCPFIKFSEIAITTSFMFNSPWVYEGFSYPFFLGCIHYAHVNYGNITHPDFFGTRLPIGLTLTCNYLSVKKLPDWLTVQKVGFNTITNSPVILPLAGHCHAHPAHFTQLGRAVSIGSIFDLMKPHTPVFLHETSYNKTGSAIVNTTYGHIPAIALTLGLDPIYSKAYPVTPYEVPPDSSSDDIMRFIYSKPPEYWDPYLRYYASNFLTLEDAAKFANENSAGSRLRDLTDYFADGSRRVAIGNPFEWIEVNWNYARIAKFGWESVRMGLDYWQLPWRLFYTEVLYYVTPYAFEFASYMPPYVSIKPFSYFHGVTPSVIEKTLSDMSMPLSEVLPMVMNVETKAGVTATVTPFGIKLPHKWIPFREIPNPAVCFYVNAYPLIDGNIVAHIYTGSGVHTFIVDGNDVMEHVFDPLPLHAIELLKLGQR